MEKISNPPTQPLQKPELELKSLCIEMNAFGLRKFITDKDQVPSNREEVTEALRFARDPAKLLLESLHLLYHLSAKKTTPEIKTTLLWLLQGVQDIGRKIEVETKERAKKLAMAWTKRLYPELFMQYLSTYELKNVFSLDDLVEIVVSVASMKHAVDLCRALGLESRVPDIIEILISEKSRFEAIKFAHAFELLGRFPPAPLLEAYMKESEKIIQEILDQGKHSSISKSQAIRREMSCLKPLIRCIKECNLESPFPLASLDMRLEELQKKDLEEKTLVKELKKKMKSQCTNSLVQ